MSAERGRGLFRIPSDTPSADHNLATVRGIVGARAALEALDTRLHAVGAPLIDARARALSAGDESESDLNISQEVLNPLLTKGPSGDLARNIQVASDDLGRNIPGAAGRLARRAAYENALLLNRRKSHAPLLTAQLGAVATLLFKGIPHSIALFTMSESAAGKSQQLLAFRGGHRALERVDEFTVAGLRPSGHVDALSGAKSRPDRKALYAILKDRVMVTSELANTFRGNPHVLASRFSTIAKWLDGDGYVIYNGTYGKQGEEGEFFCVWLGCTTVFKTITWQTMSELGTRLLFFPMEDLPKEDEVPEAELAEVADNANKGAVGVLDLLFKQHAPRGLDKTQRPVLPPAIDEQINRLTDLLATGNAMRSDEHSFVSRPKPLHYRSRIKEIVAGIVWVTGRVEADQSDIEKYVRPIISRSMPLSRGPVLLALHDGCSKVKDIVEHIKDVQHTKVHSSVVAKTLNGLKALEIVRADGESSTELHAGRPSGEWFLRKDEDDWNGREGEPS